MNNDNCLSSSEFFKCLADPTRLCILMLLVQEKELCVCELTYALALSQPKISRHIALLRDCQLLAYRKVGKWVYYRLSPDISKWQRQVIAITEKNVRNEWQIANGRLADMAQRPNRVALCCN